MATGGDWGGLIVDLMALQGAPELIGIHTNFPGAVPPEIEAAAVAGAPTPSGLSDEEKRQYEQLVFVYQHVYYAFYMASRPQTLTALADSDVGNGVFAYCPASSFPNTSFQGSNYWIDVMFEPAGTAGYTDLLRDAVSLDLGEGLIVKIASLRDLIRMKQASGRPKDLAQIPALEATLELRRQRDG